ncbi:AAA family ATPase [Candidatus Woesearchaeota archaeon]|jgi:MinD superfamily P-loop ATPase|nr:AAA family ATPase [Candidatus Woesearchaeota archaeon]MBT6040973.1 AAA family ATPase [Candidatus Woesearchaeota archaeon]MBT6336137.1 AAA family ATPase [Candidatus Woesearchaeota archaeon]MBT7928082.1 AAA family ATPase [Candidatus Woesearchaeota archaeon]
MVKIIGITGGKGGTGKSTVATALAFELAKVRKVLLVDADVDCPNDHLLLSIKRNNLETVYQRIPKFDVKKCSKCGKCGQVCKTNAIVSIKDKSPIFIPNQCNGCGNCVYVCKDNAISWMKKEIGKLYFGINYNIDFLGGELKANELVSEFIVNALNKEIHKRSKYYDFIIIDTAAGTHCPVIAALEMCDKVYSVTEPTPLGKHDLEIILGLLKKLKKKSKIIINRCDVGDRKLIKDLSKKYNVPIISEIPYSKDIIQSYAKGEPISSIKTLDIIGDLNR